MSQRSQALITYIKQRGGVAHTSEMLNSGFHIDTIKCLEKTGTVTKIAQGLYQLAGYFPSTHPDLVAASLQAPKGTICLISALHFHEATTEIPHKVELAIPKGARAPKINYPPTQFYWFSQQAWESGAENHAIEKHSIKVYCLAKTIADCFKFRNRIGIDIAREALKIGTSEKKIKPQEIMHYARICRVHTIIQPLIEMML
ncbi:MAG: transcriptional regulator [bacterium]